MHRDLCGARPRRGDGAHSPPARLEALVIAIRTYALANRAGIGPRVRSVRPDALPGCARSDATTSVPQATAGQVFAVRRRPHQSITARRAGPYGTSVRVWPGAEDRRTPSRPTMRAWRPGWEAELRLQDLQRACKRPGSAEAANVKVASRNESGRVAKVIVNGLTPGEISGQDLRMASRDRSLSACAEHGVRAETSRRRYRFTGHGSGHGVGLCVIGSLHLRPGDDARAILERYFPALTISSAAPAHGGAQPGRPVRPCSVGSGILLRLRASGGERDAFLSRSRPERG